MPMETEPLYRNIIKDAYPAPRYAFDTFDHGVNRLTISQEPNHAVFFVGPFGNTLPGDVLVFFFGDDPTPLVQMPLPLGPVGELEVHVPAAQLLRYVPDNQTGRFDIWYAVVRSLEAVYSTRLTDYLIDFQPPGGIPIFGDPPYVNTKLAPVPELEADIPQGQPLVMNVPPWENMSLGDTLFVRWGSRNLGPFAIDTTGAIGRPVQVTVPWDVIAGTDGGVARVDYFITDVVNNHSYYAAAKVVDAGVAILPRPILPDHMNGVIDLNILGPNDVGVIVAYNPMYATDLIELLVDRVTADGVPLLQYKQSIQGNTDGSVRLNIPNGIVTAVPRGEVRVRYEVGRVPLLRSDVTVASVQGAGASLQQVETPEFPDHVVDIARLSANGLLVTVPRYPFLDNRDRITITSTFTKDGQTFTDTQTHMGSEFGGGATLGIRVPLSTILPAAGGTGSIRYTVQTPDLVSVPSPARSLVVVGSAPGGWDSEFNFDLVPTPFRQLSSREDQIAYPLRFDKVFDWRFDVNNLPAELQYIGVKTIDPPFVDDYYSGNVLRIGDDSISTNVAKRIFVDLYMGWSKVRFAVSSINDAFSVSFRDSSHVLVGPVQYFTDSPRHQEVISITASPGTIKHIEIHCRDTIHIDYFKFRR